MTHLEKLDPTVHATTRRKYHIPMSPKGKLEIRSIDTTAHARRVHMAMSHWAAATHGISSFRTARRDESRKAGRTGLSGLSPLLHRAAR